MIEYMSGDIFRSRADALVNPVNTVGVSGAGLAQQFKVLYTDNYEAYRTACARGEVRLGQVFPYRIDDSKRLMGDPLWIFNFPTKGHWRSLSRLADVDAGLSSLRDMTALSEITSLAVPALGCGLGNLHWSDVDCLIVRHLGDLDCRVMVYLPVH